MIFLPLILCLCFLPNLIYTSVPFILNPGCDLVECQEPNNPALYYANHVIGDDRIHMIYSTLDELTISIFQTVKTCVPIFNYSALFSHNYTGAIQFPDTKPSNSFSLVLRRLIQFNDKNDDGFIDPEDKTITSYFLTNITATNVTFRNNNTNQPSFQLPLNSLNGSLTVDIMYPGETVRESKFPKLRTTPKSYFLNIAFQANKFSLPKTRFAFEFYLILPGIDGSKISSSKFIDDQYTPGIFTVWKLRTLSSLYPGSMLWKPVVYQSAERSIEQNTLMEIYKIKNNVALDSHIDQGIYYSILPHPMVSAFNISLGQTKDGFFTKTNYTFIQFAAGLDVLQPDSTTKFVSVALIASLALPGIVAIIAVIFIIKRRVSQQAASSYDAIDS
ncbi:unnamed protein product [Rotaria magnacalcarata]